MHKFLIHKTGDHVGYVCGLLSREFTLPRAGDLMMEHLARTANGRLTSAEALGHREFTMTKLYRSA